MQIDQSETGLMIQDYIRAKSRRGGIAESAEELGRKLESALRERIDLLGVDDEKLLVVKPEDVLGRIAELERDALREDSGVSEHKKGVTASSRSTNRNSSPRHTARPRR
jgi:hypothetical protein